MNGIHFSEGPSKLGVASSGIPVSKDMFLHLYVTATFASVKLDTYVRFMFADGSIQIMNFHTVHDSSTYSSDSYFQLSDGYILSVTSALSSGTASEGTLYASCILQHAQTSSALPSMVLFADYISTNKPLSYPVYMAKPYHKLLGNLVSVLPDDPSTGSNWSTYVGENSVWQLLSISFALNCDATVINRHVHVNLSPGGEVVFNLYFPFYSTASTITHFVLAVGLSPVALFNNRAFLPLPYPLLLDPSSYFSISVQNLQASDVLNDINYVYTSFVNQ